MNGYLTFFRTAPRLLTFGFALTFFSNFGQTFLIALFGDDIRAEFALTHGRFGLLYSAATLLSACGLAMFGRLVDRVPLPRFTVVVALALAASAAGFSAVRGEWLLFAGLFALRFTGQGFISHTAFTTMARYFSKNRGKAIAIAMLGFSAGQAVFPLPLVELKARIGWRPTWLLIGVLLAVGLPPLVLWLLKGQRERDRIHNENLDTAADAPDGPRSWRRREVLRDPHFYRVVPALMAPMFILTGLFFHQTHIAAEKEWSMTWIATCFIGLSVTQLAGSLGTGPLVDRFGAPRLVAVFLLPLAAGLSVLAAFDAPAFAMVYLVLAGFSMGAGGTIGGALWAEAYGVRHLGAIRSLTSAIGVFSTAASPVALGWLIDRGVSVEAIALGCVAGVLGASWLARGAFPRLRVTGGGSV